MFVQKVIKEDFVCALILILILNFMESLWNYIYVKLLELVQKNCCTIRVLVYLLLLIFWIPSVTFLTIFLLFHCNSLQRWNFDRISMSFCSLIDINSSRRFFTFFIIFSSGFLLSLKSLCVCVSWGCLCFVLFYGCWESCWRKFWKYEINAYY